jgi:uncharacterized protein YjdB
MFKKFFIFGILALTLAACSTTNNQFYENEPGVELVVINQGNRTVMVGSNFQFTATVTAVGGASTGVNWLISDDTVATISQSGVVTGVSVGSAVVTAISQHDPSQLATANLNVIRAPAIDSVELNQSDFNIRPGQTSTLSVTVTSVSGAPTTVTWTSSNVEVATVSPSGVVTAVSGGTATITVRSVFDSSVFDTLTVSVQQIVALSSSPSDITLLVDDAPVTITTTVAVLGDAPQTVVYASTNPSVATVSSTGVVTPIAPGRTFIVSTSSFDASFFDVTAVEVLEEEEEEEEE